MKKHSNTSTSFQLKKLQDRVAKSKEAVNRTRDAYKAELQDLNRYNPQGRNSIALLKSQQTFQQSF